MKDISDIHDVNNISTEISNRRVCIEKDVPISEWNLDLDDPKIPKRQRKGMEDMAMLLASYNTKFGNKKIQ